MPVKSEEISIKSSNHTYPLLINYNDEVNARLKRVLDDSKLKPTKKQIEEENKLLFDPLEIEKSLLSKSMWTIFTGLPHVNSKLAKERAARLQELLHFCTSTSEITNTGIFFPYNF